MPSASVVWSFLSWLMFVASGVGPFAGQSVHFRNYAPEQIPYATNRYMYEAQRHFKLLDARLARQSRMIGNTYTIVDMAVWGWARLIPTVLGEAASGKFPNLKRLVDVVVSGEVTSCTVCPGPNSIPVVKGSTVVVRGPTHSGPVILESLCVSVPATVGTVVPGIVIVGVVVVGVVVVGVVATALGGTVVLGGITVVRGVVVVVVDGVVVVVLVDPPLSPPPHPTARTIAAAPPNIANPVRAPDFMDPPCRSDRR